MFSFISVAHAVESTVGQSAARDLVSKINDAILFPLIALLMAIAFVIFIYGAFEYVKNSNNETARETGRNHLMYGVIGMLIMLSAMAILQIAAGTFGLQGELENATRDDSIVGGFSSGRGTINREPGEGGGTDGASIPGADFSDPLPDWYSTEPSEDTFTETTLPDPAWIVLQNELNETISSRSLREEFMRLMTTDEDKKMNIEEIFRAGRITQETRDVLISEMDTDPVDSFETTLMVNFLDEVGTVYDTALVKNDIAKVMDGLTGTTEVGRNASYAIMNELRNESLVSQATYDLYIQHYNDHALSTPH